MKFVQRLLGKLWVLSIQSCLGIGHLPYTKHTSHKWLICFFYTKSQEYPWLFSLTEQLFPVIPCWNDIVFTPHPIEGMEKKNKPRVYWNQITILKVLLPCGQLPKWCATAEHSFPHASRTHQQILHWPLQCKRLNVWQVSDVIWWFPLFFCYNWGGRNPSISDLPEWHHVGKPNLYAASPNVGRSFLGEAPPWGLQRYWEHLNRHIFTVPLRMKASQECYI